jgi:ergothioneine biosynthesis protein EgtB
MTTRTVEKLPMATPVRMAEPLLAGYSRCRTDSESLCAPLAIEDYGVQCMDEVSPPKWHLAHTSWFFETLVLKPFLAGYEEFHPLFANLFNSYYESLGGFHPQPRRGQLSRPTVADVYRYRKHVDAHMAVLLADGAHPHRPEIEQRTVLGINHEQQHQELLLTDIKYNFAINPLRPVYRELATAAGKATPLRWVGFSGGVRAIGHAGPGFAYDNESPHHKVHLEDYELASRPVTNGEFIEFIEVGGYRDPAHWLSDGWKAARQHDWRAPLYWERLEGRWWQMTLAGMRLVDEHAPVCHVSFYEAAAYGHWADARLPTEAEWETAALPLAVAGNLREKDFLQPVPAPAGETLLQVYGDVWEWTQSAYSPYPGYRAAEGPLGEYNGKFMSGQFVLRGGSCVTPTDHIRATYRNFFHPWDRWQFSGLRLARDAR